MAGRTFFCYIGQDDHLSFAVPNLAWDFESHAPTPGPQSLLSLRIIELETDPEILFVLALLFCIALNVRCWTVQTTCGPEVCSLFGSQCILKTFSLFVYLKNSSQFWIFLFALCIWVFGLQVCLWPTCMFGAHRDQDRCVRTPGTLVTGGCELPCDCLESNLGPLERASRVLNCWAVSPVPNSCFSLSRKLEICWQWTQFSVLIHVLCNYKPVSFVCVWGGELYVCL